MTVALFPSDLSFLNSQVRQLQLQCNIYEKLIYAGTRLCSKITGYCMLYAASISFYDQRTQQKFLKSGIYESLIHAGFKGPLSLCPAQNGEMWRDGVSSLCSLCQWTKLHKNTNKTLNWTLKWPLYAELRHFWRICAVSAFLWVKQCSTNPSLRKTIFEFDIWTISVKYLSQKSSKKASSVQCSASG